MSDFDKGWICTKNIENNGYMLLQAGTMKEIYFSNEQFETLLESMLTWAKQHVGNDETI